MFKNDIDSKGLFTFYRQQAEFEQKFAEDQRLEKLKKKSFKMIQPKDNKSVLQNHSSHHIVENCQQLNPNKGEQILHKRSFQQLNKAKIKKLSLMNQSTPEIIKKQYESEVVVILKNKKTQQDLRKINFKDKAQNGTFVKQKIFEPLQQIAPTSEQNFLLEKNLELLKQKLKKVMKKSQSLNGRYSEVKSQLENQLIQSKDSKIKKVSESTNTFERAKKVDILPQLVDSCKIYAFSNHSSNNPSPKKILPKVLVSILKNENNQIIKHLRKIIAKQNEQQKMSPYNKRNHSFIEYGSFDYENREIDTTNLNQKQKRIINILNKFTKRN